MSRYNTAQSTLGNQDGSVLVVTMVVLVLLTIFGISATNTSTIEVLIARNDYDYKRGFYLAEAAINEAGQRIENASKAELQDRSFTALTWLKQTGTDMTDIANFDYDGTGGDDNAIASTVDPEGKTYAAALEEQIATGASMDMTAQTQVYEYSLYGLNQSPRATVHIQAGYRRRF